jgi:hypothetical protein
MTALAANPPTVANDAATAVQTTSATLGGHIVATGGDNPVITIFYGPTDGGTNRHAWAQSVSLGLQAGSFTQVLAGLSPNTTYFFTVRGANSAGAGWATPSLTFKTTALSSYLTYHFDNTRQGANTNETALTLANVNTNTFQRLFTNAVDGQVYAQPLVVANVSIPGKGVHNVLYVATEHDSVYAFDADNNLGANAAPLWQTSFINTNAGITTVPQADVGSSDLTVEIGITATPAIDPVTGTIYVEAKTKEPGPVYVHRLHALDITTGLERADFNSPSVITTTGWNALRQHDRPAVTFLNGRVYLAYASHGDTTPYHGWLFAYNATNVAQQLAVHNSTPTGAEGKGGYWNGGGGPSVDAAGNMFLITGNGSFDATGPTFNANNNFAMSVLKFSTSSGLALVDYFTPFNESSSSGSDQDLGSGAALILPDSAGSVAHPHLVVGAGKGEVASARVMYLMDRDNMGRFNATDNTQIVQALTNQINGSYSTPAFWNNILFYGAAKGDGLKAFTMSGGLIQTPPIAATNTLGSGFGATPMITADGTSNGIAWVVVATSPAVLRAYNATNVAQEIYNSSRLASRDTPGNGVKYETPAVVNGKVYVGTPSSVAVFGAVPTVATPTVSPEGGVFFTNSTVVTLGDTTPGTSIFYTTDGSIPTTNSVPYGGSFLLASNATVNARAFAPGFNGSAAASATFSFGSAPTFNSVTFATNGVAQLAFSGVAGESYMLQASSDLVSWDSISTNVAPANVFSFIDSNSTNFPVRFYRVIELP